MLPAIEVLKDIQALRENQRRDVRSDAGSRLIQQLWSPRWWERWPRPMGRGLPGHTGASCEMGAPVQAPKPVQRVLILPHLAAMFCQTPSGVFPRWRTRGAWPVGSGI